jgi:hypothetical protein
LVIAYIQMREIEAEIIARRGDDKKSWIKLTQFYGIELKDFAAEIARLALLIAEFQCDVRLIGQQEALIDVLPLKNTGLITQGNALRLDWLTICPPVTKTMVEEWDLGGPTGRLALEANGLDGDEVEPETYICGNPPYRGRNKKGDDQKDDIELVVGPYSDKHKSVDYVGGWYIKGAQAVSVYGGNSALSLVATNSICQGEQVSILWPILFSLGLEIHFAYASFKWSNLAHHNAGVTVVVVGLKQPTHSAKILFDADTQRSVASIGPYLVPNSQVMIAPLAKPLGEKTQLFLGNMAKDGGHLLLDKSERDNLLSLSPSSEIFLRRFWGAKEVINGLSRFCIWIGDDQITAAKQNPQIAKRIEAVRNFRLESTAPSTRAKASIAHRFVQLSPRNGTTATIIPAITSENRDFLPVHFSSDSSVIGHKCYALYDAPLWNMALIASRLHWVWIGTVCVRMRTDFSYSNTLGWNTFPVPPLSDTQKADLTTCAQDILLAREAHWPATIADLYDPAKMPANLTAAHDRNDQTLERIYIGRRFKNDTERLEKLFELYTEMTAGNEKGVVRKRPHQSNSY